MTFKTGDRVKISDGFYESGIVKQIRVSGVVVQVSEEYKFTFKPEQLELLPRLLDGNEYYVSNTNEIVKECGGHFFIDGEFCVVQKISVLDHFGEKDILILETEDRDEGDEGEPHLYSGELQAYEIIDRFSALQLQIFASDLNRYISRIESETAESIRRANEK